MKRLFLITLAFAGLFTLIACSDNDGTNYANRYDRPNRGSYNYDYDDYNDNLYTRRYGFNSKSTYTRNYDYSDSMANDLNDRTDKHYEFVRRLGFENIVNPNGYSFHERYRLNKANAANDDIYHGWRHTWVDPDKYVDKDIDVYLYRGDYNGEPRTIHILSYNGEVLGGYHYGAGETAENASMINYKGYTSRLSDDFRGTWDGLFGI